MAKNKDQDLGEEDYYNFPAHSMTFKARSQEEAHAKLNQFLKAQKND